MKRRITETQEQALRLCHHDFSSKTVKEAAEIMGISIQAVHSLLNAVEKVAPGLFPILTVEQAMVREHIFKNGYNREETAELLHTPVRRVDSILGQLKAKGIEDAPIKVINYAAHMDSEIVRKF